MVDSTKPELRVTVFSDYICPFCYIGFVRLERLRDEYDLKVNWRLVEIHPENPVQGRPVEELGYPPEQWNEMMGELGEMARTEQIVIQPHTFTTNSRKALLLAEAAKEQGSTVFYALHKRLFEAYFGDGINIGDVEVLRELAANVGVMPDTIERAWQNQKYLKQIRQNLMAAQKLEVSGTPTYFFGERKLTGALSVDVLRHAAHELIRSNDSSGWTV
jgi:predicted DsbA family dithiol-disulfide isomerase